MFAHAFRTGVLGTLVGTEAIMVLGTAGTALRLERSELNSVFSLLRPGLSEPLAWVAFHLR